jgi:Cell division protein FtsQ
VARRLGPLKRASGGRLPGGVVRFGLAALAAVLLAALAFHFFFHASTVAPGVELPRATATIGEGEDAVAVGPSGAILEWLPLSEEVQLPTLPIDEPPPKGELGGEVLEQALVLGAAPPALRPYIESSSRGEGGVDMELRSGIELRFGDSTRLAEKWEAATAVLADPEVTALDYVDLHAPRRPAIGGSGHTLPTLP